MFYFTTKRGFQISNKKYQMFFIPCNTCSCSVLLCKHTYKVVVSPSVTTQLSLTMVPADQKYPSPYTLTWNKSKQVYVWCKGIYLQRVDKRKKHIKYTSYSSVSSVRVCSRSISVGTATPPVTLTTTPQQKILQIWTWISFIYHQKSSILQKESDFTGQINISLVSR